MAKLSTKKNNGLKTKKRLPRPAVGLARGRNPLVRTRPAAAIKIAPAPQSAPPAGKLPRELQVIFDAETGVNAALEIAAKYQLDVKRLSAATIIFRDVLLGRIAFKNLVNEIRRQLNLTEYLAKNFALEMTARRLLVFDEQLKAQAAAFIKSLGGNPGDYEQYVMDYKKQAEQEIKANQEREQAEKAEPPKPKPRTVEYLNPFDVRDPAIEIKEMINILKHHPIAVLDSDNLELRVELNVVITTLLLGDRKYLDQLLVSLAACQEPATSQKILLNNEKVEPTVENWLKDFISVVGRRPGEQVSTIEKAKYYNESPNIKNLTPAERELIDKLFDLYENLVNFFRNVERLPMTEIQVFPFTEAEQQTFLKKYENVMVAGAETAAAGQPKDIYDEFRGDTAERQAIEQAENSITQTTRNEFNKVAELFYDYFLQRKKIEIIACMNVLASIGALDDLVAKDSRFQDALAGYFQRNNMADQAVKFKANPSAPENVKHFVKYILMERLGMASDQAARIGAQIGNIYREQGLDELAQIAYYDLEQKKFFWL